MKNNLQTKLNDKLFDNINGYSLDLYQRKIILDDAKSLLVIAGAGSGKTLTIIGKIKYLIERLHVNPKEILCISFTNETVRNLKNKVPYDIDIYTFHKLSLELLKDNNYYFKIAPSDLLEYTVNEYFEGFLDEGKERYIVSYFKYYLKDDNLTFDLLKQVYQTQFLSYKKLIIKFIRLIKNNNQNFNDLKNYLQKNKYLFSHQKRYKNKYFLVIMFDIFRLYLEEVNSSLSVDFDMMISLASKITKKYGMKRYYKYIIVDEFQDTSFARYDLLKNILTECDSKVMVVGDDFQSIYKFSGCTLELFLNFRRYFSNSKVLYLINTYRNSQELVKIAYHFIKKNPYQLRKVLTSSKRNLKPVKIVYYTRSNYKYKFLNLLEKLYLENKKEILVLGRCNHDIDWVLAKDTNLGYKDMHIKYLTIHKAKGLECENVIVLNLSDDIMGFPNKIEDDDVINLFFKEKEKFLYAEERRLFYVALTRTKNNVYLMTKKDKESIFVKEIKRKCEILDI